MLLRIAGGDKDQCLLGANANVQIFVIFLASD
ncbi:hypothetical protein SMWOGL2_35860 [Sporomusa malonica]